MGRYPTDWKVRSVALFGGPAMQHDSKGASTAAPSARPPTRPAWAVSWAVRQQIAERRAKPARRHDPPQSHLRANLRAPGPPQPPPASNDLRVGETGFEPATARPPAGCATRLRHSPWSLMILRTLAAMLGRCRPVRIRTYARERGDRLKPKMRTLWRVQGRLRLRLAPQGTRSARQLLPSLQGRVQTRALRAPPRPLRHERGPTQTRAHCRTDCLSPQVLPRAALH